MENKNKNNPNNTTKAPVVPTTVVPQAPVTTQAPEVTTTLAPVTTQAPTTTEVNISTITDDLNELTNPAAKEETKEDAKEDSKEETVERRRTKKVEIMEPVNTDFPIYYEPKKKK